MSPGFLARMPGTVTVTGHRRHRRQCLPFHAFYAFYALVLCVLCVVVYLFLSGRCHSVTVAQLRSPRLFAHCVLAKSKPPLATHCGIERIERIDAMMFAGSALSITVSVMSHQHQLQVLHSRPAGPANRCTENFEKFGLTFIRNQKRKRQENTNKVIQG